MRFRAKQYIKVAETGELVAGGSFAVLQEQEIGHMRLRLYKHGALAGSERMRIKLFLSDPYLSDRLYVTSEWSRLSDADMGPNWFGWLRFDFRPKWLNTLHRYHIGVEIDGYARDGDDFYLGFALDWGMGTHGEPGALAHEVYGFRRVSYDY